MPKSEQSLIEAETIVRFDETDALATLWTASPRVRKEWESYGYKPAVESGGKAWRVECPKDRILLKTARKV